jgi:hypothetical protein
VRIKCIKKEGGVGRGEKCTKKGIKRRPKKLKQLRMQNEKKDVNAAGNIERKKERRKEIIKQSRVINDNWISEWFLLSNLNAQLRKIYAFKQCLFMYLSCRGTWIRGRVF